MAEAESLKRYGMEGHSFGTIHCLGADHPATVDSLQQLGEILERRGRLPEAEDVMRQALDGRNAKYCAHHGQLDRSRRELARILARQERHAEALELRQQILHPGHLDREEFK